MMQLRNTEDRPHSQSRLMISLLVLFLILAQLLAVSGVVKAGTITGRSLELSSSAKGTTGVNYKLGFTTISNNTNAVILDFCKNSPVVNDGCQLVGGLDVDAVAATGSDMASKHGDQSVLIELGATADAGSSISVELTDITNPYDSGTFYARIVTYGSVEDAAAYESGTPGVHLDDGAVAVTITDAIGVGGAVLETLEFCASGEEISGLNCSSELASPELELADGKGLGLDLATSSIYTAISTNAVSGAVVSLRSDAVGCGGLIRQYGERDCGVEPQVTPGSIVNGAGRFGLRLGTVSNGTGNILPVEDYSTKDFYLHYASDDSRGVTSPFGDPIYYTDNLPLSGGGVEIVFGANRSPNTPPGDYQARFSLIATGKF